MPLESHHKLSVRTKKQKSSAEEVKAEALLKRVRGMIDKENLKDRHKFAQETGGELKEFLQQMKPKNTPPKKAPREKDGDNNSNWTYNGIGGKAVKNHDGTEKMKVFGLKFGNENGELALGAMLESQQDTPKGEVRSGTGVGVIGSFKF